MRKLSDRRIRIIAMILAIVTIFTSTPLSIIAGELDLDFSANTETQSESVVSDDCKSVTLLHNGAEKSSITLDKNGEEILTAFTNDLQPSRRSWQILLPGENKWVNIQGQNGVDLKVSYSLVGSMLDENDCAYIRTVVSDDSNTYYSDSVQIVVSHNTSEEGTEQQATGMMMMRSARAVTIADGDESFETFSIIINYIFDNNAIAFEPYGASVAKGSDFVKSITSPVVVGYDPFIQVDGEYKDATVVDINLTNIQQDTVINVIYKPAIVDYQIHHHLQDLYDDAYSLHADFITYAKGVTGTIVADGLAMTENELPGFTALAYEKLTIAADGSTVVEIRYNRNYYLVNFDMNGGYGTEPVYTRFGTTVGANQPTRHGYVFNGWKLVSYDGQAPTNEQASMYDINSATIQVPSANLSYQAIWTTQITNYTMVFWKENIEDTGFTYWGSLDGLTAMSGSFVNGADRISEVGGIDDEDCFTYSDALTDKNIIVEGDGSTVVNVYYTRNRYTITFKATGKCTIPTNHTHTDDCYQLLCTKGHVHDSSCTPRLSCTLAVHEEHTEECVICGNEAHTHSASCCGKTEHTHTKSCYNNVSNTATPSGAPTGVQDGYIYSVRSGFRRTYYIYIGGTWYTYNGSNVSNGDVVNSKCGYTNHTHGSSDCSCSIKEHAHTDTCYRDTLHTHDENACYTYSCGSDHHVHSSGCSILNCGIPTGHSHSTTCNNASSTNTVKIEYRKYQENLESIWPVVDDNGVSYDSGERWTPSGSDTYSNVLVYIASMPGESFTLTLSKSSADTFIMNYYLEVLDGDPYDVTYNNKNYKLYTTVKANYNYITKAEDFFDINGFYQIGSNPAFGSNGQIDINGGGTVNFYYGRIVDHYLEFNNNGIVVSDKTQYGVPYGANLSQYNFIPDYPSSLEPGAFEFAGWYTSPGLFDGTEVNWDTLTMDEGDVMLYAKWKPITHSIKVYLDSSLSQQIGDEQLVSHGNFAIHPSETITNGNYIFQGWFYMDTTSGEAVEKAFVFTGIPVIKDLKIYAKWSSHVTVNYTINYVLFSTGEVIADPTVGSAIAGHNKTFYAKTDLDLYSGFQTGYYPLTSSHTVTMSAESDHEFTFQYVYVESMPYMVKYVDEYGNEIMEPKRVYDNNLSVVTETFIRYSGKMPDAYQKRLVLSASDIDEDGDGIYDNNVITFIYSSDYEHAYYRIVHYTENLTGDGYREYRSEETVGIIGESYKANFINITGFSFNGAKTVINGVETPGNQSQISFTLSPEGSLIELYYDRVDVGYVVKYLERGTNKVLYQEKRGEGIFGEQIIEYAPGLTHIGYVLVGDSVKQIHLSATESMNIIEFYYQETTYSLKYQVVGSPEGATLSMSSENILAVSGEPTGSIPYISQGYHYVGWYYDESCTNPVPTEWINQENKQITPQSDGVWLASHTYYVKIDPDFTSMTIGTLGSADIDEGQIFIFRITGTETLNNHIDLTVTVIGNGSVTIDHLPVGTYNVSEISGWSFRYTPDSQSRSIKLSVIAQDNVLVFSHIRSITKWLDGSANSNNHFN